VVDKDDVLDAMGSFVAAYLTQLPQAQNLQPAELQKAIKQAFKVNTPLIDLQYSPLSAVLYKRRILLSGCLGRRRPVGLVGESYPIRSGTL
jgi:hypothetical protein